MKVKRLKNSILAKLVLLISLLTIVPILVLGTVSYNVSGNILKKELKASAEKAQDKIVANIDLGLHDVAGITSSLSESSKILAELQAEGNMSQDVKRAKYAQLLNGIQTSSSFPVQVMFIDSKENLFYDAIFLDNYNPNKIIDDMQDKVTHSQWYRNLFKYDSKLIWLGRMENYDIQSGGKTILYIAKNITNGDSYIGTVLIGLQEYYISKQLNNALISSESSIFLLDEDDQIILSSEDSNEALKSQFTSMGRGDLKRKLDSGFVKAGNVDFIVNQNRFSYFGWQLVQLTPEKSLFSKFYYIGNLTMLLMAACFVMIVIAMLLLKQHMIGPVLYLSKTMRKVQDGDLSVRSTLVRSDEIGILSNGFNKMISEINNLIIRIKTEEKAKREMEFNVLQAQIKPHFLYNALNSIKWMADIKSQGNISKAVTTLVKMMEYNMNERSKFVTLKQELEYLSWYVHLCSIRYGNSFDCAYDMDEDLQGTFIIKLILQPIVENSITHGICGISGRGLITLSCRRQQSDMKITISDNGRGIHAESLEKIRRNLSAGNMRKDKPGGMGISNVNNRLGAEYGPGYSLEIDSGTGMGVTVSMLVPIHEHLPSEGGNNETACD
jgi:two-component system, sensor histidine kinase YesM